MPDYGFSGKPTTTGWGPERITRAWTTLMRRLGDKHFVAQGGDWGAVITDMLGVQAPPELLGIHTNMPGAIPADIDQASFAGALAPSGLSDEERRYIRSARFILQAFYYALWMTTRPQTTGEPEGKARRKRTAVNTVSSMPIVPVGWYCRCFLSSLQRNDRAFQGPRRRAARAAGLCHRRHPRLRRAAC
jgi:pimeloyl-ACP methyl ester carboxylesterase